MNYYDKEKNMPIVLLPIEGSPAEKSGIQAGDYIEYVDDLYSVGSDYDTVIDAIKGIIGTTVKVGLIRQDEDKNYTRLEVEVERQKIQINPVKSSVYSNSKGTSTFL